MAVPTIISITPTAGSARGSNVTIIVGTNFNEYTPPAYGYVGGSEPSYVEVLFNNVASDDVQVISPTELVAVPPAYTGDADQDSFPAVDVVVKNLDASFVPIPGEEDTLTGAYTYEREHLRPPTQDTESGLIKVTRTLLQLFKRQVIKEVSSTTHTDFSSDGIGVSYADLPNLAVTGPRTIPDEYGYENENPAVEIAGGVVEVWPAPIQETLIYELMGYSDSDMEMKGLMAACRKVFKGNPYLIVNADVPENETIRLPMMMTTEPAQDTANKNTNLHRFRAEFEVRRVPILYLPPHLETRTVATMELQAQKFTGTLVETITL
jgi:hypothetical protein